jgi:hypothetical protein
LIVGKLIPKLKPEVLALVVVLMLVVVVEVVVVEVVVDGAVVVLVVADGFAVPNRGLPWLASVVDEPNPKLKPDVLTLVVVFVLVVVEEVVVVMLVVVADDFAVPNRELPWSAWVVDEPTPKLKPEVLALVVVLVVVVGGAVVGLNESNPKLKPEELKPD